MILITRYMNEIAALTSKLTLLQPQKSSHHTYGLRLFGAEDYYAPGLLGTVAENIFFPKHFSKSIFSKNYFSKKVF